MNFRIMDTIKSQYEEAETEWDNVAEITPNFLGDQQLNESTEINLTVSLTTVEDIIEYISKANMEEYLNQVKHGPVRKGFRKYLSCLLGPPGLPPHLRQTQKLVQATALISFSNEV